MGLKVNDSGQKKIQEALFRKGLILESMIKKRSPVFTGQYKSLWETQKNSDGSVSVVNPQGEKGRALEFGGEPGNWPPVSELRKWVRRKGLASGEEEVDSTAYLVGRSIFQSGIEPQPHVRPAVKSFKNREM
jgi:hypothetical protein